VRSSAQTEPAAGVGAPADVFRTGRAFVALSPGNYRALAHDRDERRRQVWPGEVEFIEWPRGETRLRALARLLRTSRRYDAIVLDGSVGLRSGYADLWAAGLIGRRRGAPVVLIADATWKRGVSALDRLACRVGIRLVDGPSVHYCVLSRDETRIFPRTWGVAPEKLFFTPWPYTLGPGELGATSADGPIFAGGDSLRDYGPLIEAARGVEAEIRIATRREDVAARSDLPANVSAGPVPHEQFIASLRSARAVVVPLVPTLERSAGQTTYVNAMALGKLVVVTDCLGVRDYVENGRTGLIVPPGDAAELARALRWATDPSNREEAERIGARAREVARERFSPDEYVINLLRAARASHQFSS
jgi:hypothetical protein